MMRGDAVPMQCWEDRPAAARMQRELSYGCSSGSGRAMGSSGSGKAMGSSAEDVGTQEKRKKKDLSKVKCFHYGELGHFANQCPRKKSKGEASKTKAAPARAEREVEEDDDCAMSAHVPLEKKWGDIEL